MDVCADNSANPLLNLLKLDGVGDIILEYVSDPYHPVLRITCKWLNKRIQYGTWDAPGAFYAYYAGGHDVLIRYAILKWHWVPSRTALLYAARHRQWKFFDDDALIASIRKGDGLIRYNLGQIAVERKNYDLAIRVSLLTDKIAMHAIVNGDTDGFLRLLPHDNSVSKGKPMDTRLAKLYTTQTLNRGHVSSVEWLVAQGYVKMTDELRGSIIQTTIRHGMFDDFTKHVGLAPPEYMKNWLENLVSVCVIYNRLEMIIYLCDNHPCPNNLLRVLHHEIVDVLNKWRLLFDSKPELEYFTTKYRSLSGKDWGDRHPYICSLGLSDHAPDEAMLTDALVRPIGSLEGLKIVEKWVATFTTGRKGSDPRLKCACNSKCDRVPCVRNGGKERCPCECAAMLTRLYGDTFPEATTPPAPFWEISLEQLLNTYQCMHMGDTVLACAKKYPRSVARMGFSTMIATRRRFVGQEDIDEDSEGETCTRAFADVRKFIRQLRPLIAPWISEGRFEDFAANACVRPWAERNCWCLPPTKK
jgi:hypothetical protein